MKIYDETTREELANPDLSAGRVYDGTIATGEAVEVLPGTATADRPGGLRRRVTVTEPCRYYHRFTEAEQAALAAAGQPSALDRLEAQATYTAMMTDTLLEV